MSDYEVLLDSPNLTLMQMLIANDTAALPFEELEYLNPNDEAQSLREGLSELVDEGFVEIMTVETPEDVPSVYYAPTIEARDSLEELRLWSGLRLLYDVYQAVETPERIEYIRKYYPDGPLIQDSEQ